MNTIQISSIVVAIVFINATLLTILPLPGIINLIALTVGAFLLLKNAAAGGILGKINLFIGMLIAIFALSGVLGLVGISIPFTEYVFRVYRLGLIAGSILLIANACIGG